MRLEMDTNTLDEDQELHSRYQRAASQLEPWKSAIDAMTEEAERGAATTQYAKVEKLAAYVAGRLSELKFARDNGLDYLCKDAAKKVDEFEREILKLKTGLDHQGGSGNRGNTIQDMRNASHSSAQLAPPVLPASTASTSVVRAMKANAATSSQPVSKTRFADVVTEIEQWDNVMERLSAKIRHFERNLPEGVSTIESRRRAAEMQTKHRRAMERIGRCKGWVRTGSARLATTNDWFRDFEIARVEIQTLETLVEEGNSPPSQMPPPPVPQNKPSVKTVPIGRANKGRLKTNLDFTQS